MPHPRPSPLRGGAIAAIGFLVACSVTNGATPVPSPGSDASLQPTYDGTVGHPCATDADCFSPGGPRENRCSLAAFADGPLMPTPVCVLPTCDPGTDGAIHDCDGPDGDPSTPGVCYDMGGGQGLCLPACSFAADGSAPQGCLGKDVCNFYGTGINAAGQVYGVGYCLGGCAADSDCPARSACDVTTGLCVSSVTTPVLSLGQACTPSALNPGCNCFGDVTGAQGYCSTFCITGSTAAPCPAGYVCDSTEPAASTANSSVLGFTKPTPGLAGWCLAACGESSVAADAGPGDAAVADAEAVADAVLDVGVDANVDAAVDSGPADAGDDETADAPGDASDGAADAQTEAAMDAADAADGSDASDSAADAGDPATIPACPAQSTCSFDNVAGPDCLP